MNLQPHDRSDGPETPEPYDVFDEEEQEAAPPPPQAPGPHHAPVSTAFDRGTGRRLRIFAALAAVGLAAGFFLVHRITARDAEMLAAATEAQAGVPPTVDFVIARLAPSTQELILPGETRAWYQTTLYARVSGYLAKWFVDIGDHVHKGEVLATIDTPELDAQLLAARAQLNAADADVVVKQSDADFAKSTYDRWRESPKGVVSDQEREEKKAAYESANAQLKAAQARVNLDQADVDRLTFLTQFKNVTAPFDGTITERRIDIGDLVTAGSTASTTPLFIIAQSDTMRIFADVPQYASAELPPGASAQITARELPNRTFNGKITRTSSSIDPHARTLRVEVDIPNTDLALVPGMYVQVAFHLKPKALVQVPASALIFRSAGPQVAVIEPDSTVNFRDVTIARDDGSFVELGSGVMEGDRVALNISSQITNGEKVNAVEADKGPATAKR